MASSSKTVNYSTGGLTGVPILGINIEMPSSAGGGIPGLMAPATNTCDRSYLNYEQPRFSLRDAWNTTYPSQLRVNGLKRICTPFRAVNNAGDILCREHLYYSCGGSNQTPQSSRQSLRGLRQHYGHISSQCDGTGVPASTCNTKWVYDSSDYITYKKQRAMVKNYNDLASGGNISSASQSASRAIRRY